MKKTNASKKTPSQSYVQPKKPKAQPVAHKPQQNKVSRVDVDQKKKHVMGVGEKFMKKSGPLTHSIDTYVRANTVPKSTSRKSWNFLTGAAKVVADLAPAFAGVAPFFLATHPPTQLNALRAGAGDQLAAAQNIQQLSASIPQGSVGIASGNPFQCCVGINMMKTVMKNGVLHGARVVGMDKIADISNYNFFTGAAWQEGDLIKAVDLNPTGPSFFGTALIQQARIYNRYKIHNMAVTFVSSAPSTYNGSLIISCTPDPSSPYGADGIYGTQLATAVEGAETFQIWQSGTTMWYGDKSQNFYSRPDNTDPRFVSPGIVNLVCNSTCGAGNTSLGSLYVSYDIEFTERSLEEIDAQQIFQAQFPVASIPAGATNILPLGTPTGVNGLNQVTTATQAPTGVTIDPPIPAPNGSIPLVYAVDSSGYGALGNWPAGLYLVGITISGTAISAFGLCGAFNDGNATYLTAEPVFTTSSAASVICGYAVVRCTKQVPNATSRLRIGYTGGTPTAYKIWVARAMDQVTYGSVSISQQVDSLQKKIDELTKKLDGDTEGKNKALKVASCLDSLPARAHHFKLGTILSPTQVTTLHAKWVNQEYERKCPTDKGYVFVVWEDDKRLKVVSIPRLLSDSSDDEDARTHNYEVAARTLLEGLRSIDDRSVSFSSNSLNTTNL